MKMKRYNSNNAKSSIVVFVMSSLIFLASVGWVWNIMKIYSDESMTLAITLLRIAGIFVAPLGSILGFL